MRGVQAAPANMELTGPPEELAQLRTPTGLYVVETEPVSIEGRKGIVNVDADLALPEGVHPVNPQAPGRVEVTADIQDATREECLQLGAKVFLNKPYTKEDLEPALRQFIDPKPGGEVKC